MKRYLTASVILLLLSASMTACSNKTENETPAVTETAEVSSETTSESITGTAAAETSAATTEKTTVKTTVSETESESESTTLTEPVTVTESEPTVTTAVTTAETTSVTTTAPVTTTTAVPETTAVTTVSETVTEAPAETTVTDTAASVTAVPAETTAARTTVTEPPAYDETSVSMSDNVKVIKKIKYVTYAEYFRNSLFIGDSICSGLKIYRDLLNVENVAARANVGTWSVNTYTFRYSSATTAELDCYSIAGMYLPEDIYLWMGMNDINMVSEEKFVANYAAISAKLHEVSPNSKIHIVSISPISQNHKWNYNNHNGTNKILRYNAAVEQAFADSEYVDFISIYDSLTDQYGFLGAGYSGGDGLHLNGSAYKAVLNKIIEYKKAHREQPNYITAVSSETLAETSAE